MFYFVLILELLWRTTCIQAACSNATICVASGNDSAAECQLHDVSNTFYRLHDLPLELRRCEVVRIYMTSGTHFLSENLDFPESEETGIYGASHGQPTIVECLNNTGIEFFFGFKRHRVFLSNIVFTHCNRIRDMYIEGSQPVALYFENVLYSLQNVEVKNTEGYGLYASECTEQVVINSTFSNNTKGHVKIMLNTFALDYDQALVKISATQFLDGHSETGGTVYVLMQDRVRCNVSIINCVFLRNIGGHFLLTTSYIRDYSSLTLNIENSTFSSAARSFGVSLKSTGIRSTITATIHNSTFSNNENGALYIANAVYIKITGSNFTNNNSTGISITTFAFSAGANFTAHVLLEIGNCLVQNNTGSGIDVRHTAGMYNSKYSSITFINNSRALFLYYYSTDNGHYAKMSDCHFKNHRLTYRHKEVVTIKSTQNSRGIGVLIERSSFVGNRGAHGDCSVLHANNMNLTISDVNITDNNCTGISLLASRIKLATTINLARNHGLQGGALSLKSSKEADLVTLSILLLATSSIVNIVNNTADAYGGGIFSEETCNNRDVKRKCFFQFETSTEVFAFSGNRANRGGDMIFGGCLSNCWVYINKTQRIINKNDPKNIFWDLVSFENVVSQSTFVEYPKRVKFCGNESSEDAHVHSASCSDSYSINVYRGQMFTVPLMVVADYCFPSVELIQAKINDVGEIHLEQSATIQMAQKYCYNFSYFLTGGLQQNITTVELTLLSSDILPALLTVHLNECPTGYELNSEGQCDCQDVLKLYKIGCNLRTYSLEIPALTWVGELREGSGSIAVQKDCQYCNIEETRTITNISRDSDKLCIANRTGIMCGACIEGNSLQLGGYECADCYNSTHEGILLLIAFLVVGIALVLLLLGLNLTVSTGMMNGLIFYSNVIYLNSDALLPITRNGNGTHLQNTVKFLSTFQAWMNLDFGIITCFFDGYDTYIGTWMQFVFPLYIWLLILVIVLSSRYSSRIARITTSNTVSVLATLLLLSYAKLLKTSIDVASFTDVEFLSGSSKYRVWMQDGNIPYLHSKHTLLFLMSMLTITFYIVPFSLLILLGPLLQTRSHYKLLAWVNKLKPFLDAFYGPYTRSYRYWPGILLLARLIIFGTFSFYSLGETSFKLVTVSVIVVVLLVTWMLIGKTNNTSLHRKRSLNYLELFFLLNLAIFAIASIYHSQVSKYTLNQQGLAVAMVGSVLVAFCGVLTYQIFCFVSRYEAVRKIVRFLPTKLKSKEAVGRDQSLQDVLHLQEKTEAFGNDPTHSSVEMMREPLLMN